MTLLNRSLFNQDQLFGVGWLVGGKTFSLTILFLVNVLLARHLGVDDFGKFSYIVAFVGLFTPLASLGFNGIVSREILADPANEQRIMSTVVAFRCMAAIGTLLTITVLLTLPVLSMERTTSLGVLILAFGNVFLAIHVVEYWFEAKFRIKELVLIRLFYTVVFSLLKLVLIFADASFIMFLWVLSVETAIIGLFLYCGYSFGKGKLTLSAIDAGYGFRLLSQSKWLVLSGVASVIYLKIDQVMLGQMVSAEEVGVYAVVSRISEVWYFVPSAIMTAFFPTIMARKQESSARFHHILQSLCDGLLVLALALAGLVTFAADLVIRSLYGAQYEAASALLVIHVWAGVFIFMRAMASRWLIIEKLAMMSFLSHGLGALTNIGLNFILIPKYQGLGAAYATVISYSVASYFAFWLHGSTRPVAVMMTKSYLLPLRALRNASIWWRRG